MGFSTLIDILGSTIVGGMLLLILFRVNDSAIQNNYVFGSDLIVQEGLVEAVRIIEYDFRKIGYCKDYTQIPIPSRSIISADSTSISFLTDVATTADPRGDGIVDTIKYVLGSTNELSQTSNPRDRILYRIVNSETPAGSNVGITEFRLTYFNALGKRIPFPVTQPSAIYTIQIDLKLENIEAVTDVNADPNATGDEAKIYSSAVWRQIRLAARNLRNR